MPAPRVVTLLLLLYVGLDFVTPCIPGVFFFANEDLFIGTVVGGKVKTAAVLSCVAAPARTRDDTGAAEPALRSTAVAGVVVAPGLARGAPRGRPAERSSLPPSPLDDH